MAWFFLNAGYETTDDATIEAHVIQVSPKISAHVKAVRFDDNYQVKRGDLLIELDPRDFDVSLASAQANLASAQSKLIEAEAQQKMAQAGLGQDKSGSRQFAGHRGQRPGRSQAKRRALSDSCD